DYVIFLHYSAVHRYLHSFPTLRSSDLNSGVRGLVNKYVAGSFNGYQMYFVNGNLCAWYMKDSANYVYDGTNCTLSTPGYNDGGWHQAVFVVDTAGGRLYVDGAQKATRAWTGVAGAGRAHLGSRLAGHSPKLPAARDKLRVYNRQHT